MLWAHIFYDSTEELTHWWKWTSSIPWANRGILWTCRIVEGLKRMSFQKSHLPFSHRLILREPRWVLSNMVLLDKDLSGSGCYTCKNLFESQGFYSGWTWKRADKIHQDDTITNFSRRFSLTSVKWRIFICTTDRAGVRGLCVTDVKTRKAVLLLRENST